MQILPGCMIGSVDFADLLMDCGVLLQCPLCVGVNEAYDNRDFWPAHYHDGDHEEAIEYKKTQHAGISHKPRDVKTGAGSW